MVGFRFSVIFDEQRELAARVLNEQLPALPSKPGKKHIMPPLPARAQPIPTPRPLASSGPTLDASTTRPALSQRPASGGSAKPRNIVLGHADKRFVLEDVESVPKQLRETPSFRLQLFQYSYGLCQ